MFGLSFGELVIIAVVALLVLGPQGLPGLARTLGKLVRQFRHATSDLRSAMETEFYRMDDPPRPKVARPEPEGAIARADPAASPPGPPADGTAPAGEAGLPGPAAGEGAASEAAAAPGVAPEAPASKGPVVVTPAALAAALAAARSSRTPVPPPELAATTPTAAPVYPSSTAAAPPAAPVDASAAPTPEPIVPGERA